MQSQGVHPKPAWAAKSWSNRILIAALIGIFFLTLFPFRLLSHARLHAGVSRFLLGKSLGKTPGDVFDDFLNVLLFIPLGFGLAEKLFEKRISRATTFAIVWSAGLALSYGIEFTQLYIPGRDSGWEDVLTNSTGCALGFLLFVTIGAALLGFLTRIERMWASFITTGRLAVVLLVWFLCWFAFSARLQTRTGLTDWSADSQLLVGSDAVGRPATSNGPGAQWNGRISKLEIWDRALPRVAAMSLTDGSNFRAAIPQALAAYDLASGPPFADSRKALPDLTWSSIVEGHGEPSHLVLDNGKSLMLVASARELVWRLQRTNQFTIHIVCKPEQGAGSDGQIILISPSPTMTDLTVRQEGTSLGFWFRSPLSARRAQLAWYVPNVFSANESRNIAYAYDGSRLYLYMDGKLAAAPYRLGPGAALAHLVRRIKTNELDGYHDIYYALVFFPAGVVLGIGARAARAEGAAAWTALATLWIAPCVLFELVLMGVSGRAFAPGSLLLSVLLAALGAAWINADGAAGKRAEGCVRAGLGRGR